MRWFRPARAGRCVIRAPFDEILDLDVHDGFVYYRSLKLGGARFNRIVDQLVLEGQDGGRRGDNEWIWD